MLRNKFTLFAIIAFFTFDGALAWEINTRTDKLDDKKTYSASLADRTSNFMTLKLICSEKDVFTTFYAQSKIFIGEHQVSLRFDRNDPIRDLRFDGADDSHFLMSNWKSNFRIMLSELSSRKRLYVRISGRFTGPVEAEFEMPENDSFRNFIRLCQQVVR